MSKITTAHRNALSKSEFAIPSERKYPVDTHNRAANAKARASQQFNKGHVSLKMLHEIDEKADKVLHRK
jgi:hypothetical protein